MATAEYTKEIEQQPVKRRVSVSGILRHLGVSRSGYHAWLNRKPSKTTLHKNRIQQKIKKIHDESHQIYGAPKIARELQKEGERVSERTVGKYMRELEIKAHYIKPYVQTTVNSDFSQSLQNILDEQFNPEQPNAVWVSDITYIWTYEGFAYLTSIMDLYSRKIVSWVLSRTLEATHVVEAVEKAKESRDLDKPLVFHSDRGVQYVSECFLDATEDMVNSYSKKAYPWDNACIESFHALIKREWLYRFKIFNYQHAYRLVFEYIETFYNTVRSHSHCGYLSPDQFENRDLDDLEKALQKKAS